MRLTRPLAVLAGTALALGPALPAAASHDVTPARIGGETRFSTAAEIALEDYPQGADEVIVASGEVFPDALAGAPVAAEIDAPVLLTRRDEVPDATMSALSELDPDHVTILGGPAAVSEETAATISQSARVNTDRIQGDTRYATAAEIARFVQAANDNAGNWPGGQRAVFLTTGENFPDALAAGAPAASSQESPIPILLTETDTLSAEAEAAIEDLEIELVVIVGGPTAVSEEVERAVDDDDTTVDRVAGDTRTATATAVADYAMEFLGFDAADIALTRGNEFPDALSVAPVAGKNANPILLTRDSETLSEPTRDWLAQQCEAVQRIRAVGLEQAITTATLEDAEQTAENCHSTTDQSFIVAPQQPIEASPGDEQLFEVIGRYDDQAVSGAVDVALFPCESLQEPSDGEFRFADEAGDGVADGLGSTRTDAAVITAVNGEDIADTKVVRDVSPDAEGDLRATVTSDADDCAVAVYFDDADDDGELDVDADGLPTEDWGIGVIEWTAG